MNRNIKIQNILHIVQVSKSIQMNQCIQQKISLITFLYVFPIFFQSLMGPKKWMCDVPCGTNQSYFHLQTWSSLLEIASYNHDVYVDPLSIIFFTLQLLLKTPNVLHVVFLFTNFWVPKLYLCLVFHTYPSRQILIFFKIRIHVLSLGFLIHLFLQTSSHHPIHIILQIFRFPLFLGIFFDLGMDILYCLNLCLLLPKKIEIKIYNKTLYLLSNFEIYKKWCFQ
jgi:hypothetical protein